MTYSYSYSFYSTTQQGVISCGAWRIFIFLSCTSMISEVASHDNRTNVVLLISDICACCSTGTMAFMFSPFTFNHFVDELCNNFVCVVQKTVHVSHPSSLESVNYSLLIWFGITVSNWMLRIRYTYWLHYHHYLLLLIWRWHSLVNLQTNKRLWLRCAV